MTSGLTLCHAFLSLAAKETVEFSFNGLVNQQWTEFTPTVLSVTGSIVVCRLAETLDQTTIHTPKVAKSIISPWHA
jgi:hypothetical protein